MHKGLSNGLQMLKHQVAFAIFLLMKYAHAVVASNANPKSDDGMTSGKICKQNHLYHIPHSGSLYKATYKYMRELGIGHRIIQTKPYKLINGKKTKAYGLVGLDALLRQGRSLP